MRRDRHALTHHEVSALETCATLNTVDPSNPHRRAEARSLALHHEVAQRIRERPELLEPIRTRVEGWLRDGTVARPYAEAWREILSRDLDALLDALEDPSERGRDLRQCTPFAGILDPRTRWRILREASEDWPIGSSSPIRSSR